MKYNRILLKLSGESLMGTQKYGLSTDCDPTERYCRLHRPLHHHC